MSGSQGYTIFYHGACKGFWGRAFGPIATLKQAGATFEIKTPEAAPQGIGFAVPFATFPQGFSLSQTSAITHTLGVQLGLIGSGSPEESAVANQLMNDTADVFSELTDGKPDERLSKWFEYFGRKLGGQGYFQGDNAGAVDFNLYAVMWTLAKKKEAGKCTGVEVPANLTAWVSKMEANAVVATMIAETVILPPSFI